MNAIEQEREHLSATSLKQLQSCALQFRLQRLDGLSRSHRSPALITGGIYHGVLASALLMLRDDQDVTKDKLVEIYEERWDAELKISEPPIRWSKKATLKDQHELGRALVGAWFEQGLPIFKAAEQILAVEMPFRVPVFNRHGEVLETPLEGFIDVVYKEVGGQTIVVDHKTSASKFGDVALELDLQPTVYRHALRFLGYDDNAVFRFHVITKAKSPKLSIVEVPRGEDDFDRLHWLCENAEQLIRSGLFLPATGSDWRCESCEFLAGCKAAHRDLLTPDPEPTVAAKAVAQPVA
jgi:putative RecB family exonuclease